MYHLISVLFSELSSSTTGVTFTVVCSEIVMSCIGQVSLFKISSKAVNITSSTINCNRSSNFNFLQPQTDYMILICFSDLQCINTTFVTGNSKRTNLYILITCDNYTSSHYRCNVIFSSSPCHWFMCTDINNVNSHPIIHNNTIS